MYSGKVYFKTKGILAANEYIKKSDSIQTVSWYENQLIKKYPVGWIRNAFRTGWSHQCYNIRQPFI